MVRRTRLLVLPLAAFALFLAAQRGSAQTVIVTQPAPVVSYYYAPPPPVVLPAPPPVTTYYAPATAVTTYRYGAVLPRRRVTVTTYSPVVTYAPPVVVRPAPRYARYYTPAYVYP